MTAAITARQRLARFFFLPALFYLAGHVALTWPAILSFRTHFFGDDNDTLQNVWNIWWVRIAIAVRHVSPYFTDALFHPDGVTLIPQTLAPFNGLLAIPLGTVLGPFATYNLLTIFAFVAGGMTAFALAWHVSKSWLGSLFCGAVFTFSHFHFAHARGHMQLVSLQWIPLFVLCFLRMLESPTKGRGAVAGLALCLVATCDWYYVFYCVLAGVGLYVHRSVQQRAPVLLLRRGYRSAFATFLAIVVPPLGAFAWALRDVNRRDVLEGAHDPSVYSSDLLACFIPGGSWRFAEWTKEYWEHLPGGICELSAYLGFSVLAVVSFARRRVAGTGLWLALAFAFWLLSLGPVLRVVGIPLSFVPMPYRLLEVLIPMLSLSGCPARMTVMVTLFLGVASAQALVPFLHAVLRFRVLQVLFFALFVFEYLPWEQALSRIEIPDHVRALDKLPPGAIHIAGIENTSRELYLQTVHRRAVTLGYVTRCPSTLWHRAETVAALLEQHRYAELLRTFQLRYLVLPNSDPWPWEECAPIYRGAESTVWVAKEDALAHENPLASELPGYRTDSPDDQTLRLQIRNPGKAGRDFVCVFSLARAEPPTEILGAPLPLTMDAEAMTSLDPENKTYRGSVGVLDAEGTGMVWIDRAQLRQRGVGELRFCWYLYIKGQPPRIESVGVVGKLRIE